MSLSSKAGRDLSAARLVARPAIIWRCTLQFLVHTDSLFELSQREGFRAPAFETRSGASTMSAAVLNQIVAARRRHC